MSDEKTSKSDLEKIKSTLTDINIQDTLQSDDLQPVEQTEAPARLEDSKSSQSFQIYSPKSKIGRAPTNEIVIAEDDYVSRFHAWITCEDGHYFVEDLGSTNGTLLNGSPLVKRERIVHGDHLRVGRRDLKFQEDDKS